MPHAPALAYPDAIATVVDYLHDALIAAGRPVRVSHRIPNPRPVELILVSRTGGPEVLPMVDGAQMTLDCWAADTTAAWDIAALVRRLVSDLAGTLQDGVSIHRVVEFGGPQDLPDPVSNTPRVEFTVQLQIRGQAA